MVFVSSTSFGRPLVCVMIRELHTVIQLQSLQRQLTGIRSTTENWQQRRASAQRELETTRRRVMATQNDNTVALEQLQQGHMQLGDDHSDDNAATTNNPSFLAAQDFEDALLERLANVEDEIPRASSRALKHANLLFQTIRVEIQLAHSAPLPNQQHLVLTLAPTTIVPHTVETFLRNLDFYAGWTLHVSPQHHRIEIVQSVRPGLYVSTTTVGGTAAAVNVHQVALSEHASWDDVPIRPYAVVYKGQGPSFGIVMDNSTASTTSSDSVIGYVTQGQPILDYMYGRGALVTATVERLQILPSEPENKN